MAFVEPCCTLSYQETCRAVGFGKIDLHELSHYSTSLWISTGYSKKRSEPCWKIKSACSQRSGCCGNCLLAWNGSDVCCYFMYPGRIAASKVILSYFWRLQLIINDVVKIDHLSECVNAENRAIVVVQWSVVFCNYCKCLNCSSTWNN